MRLLLIEDDRRTADFVRAGLSQAGHTADWASDGVSGAHMAEHGAYDVLIVDRMLPGKAGLELVGDLRAAGCATPVLFLTSLGGVGDRVEGLEKGGDDYLVKPFAFSELLARVQALARRPPLTRASSKLKVGDLELDLARHVVTRAGRRIDLTAQEFRLLEFLMRRGGEAVTRTMLLEGVLGSALRAQDQRGGRPHQPPARQGGQRLRPGPDQDRARRRLHDRCLG